MSLFIIPLHILSKTKILSMICPGLSENHQKLIPSKKKKSVLITKISSSKIQKIANPQNYLKLINKFRATRYTKRLETENIKCKVLGRGARVSSASLS